MKTKLLLARNQGFPWFSKNGVHAKGYIFSPQGELFSNEKMPLFFSEIESFSDFRKRVAQANGSFSVVIEKAGHMYAANDYLRTFPLFFVRKKEELWLSDCAEKLKPALVQPATDEVSAAEFLATAFVSADKTLIRGINQIQAGEAICFAAQKVFRYFYFRYSVSACVQQPYLALKENAKEIFWAAARRFVQSLGGRTVAIPLSGGFDSRLIAAMLKLLNYKKVFCFTYGRKNNAEIPISKRVAQKLGFQWHFVEYNESLIHGYLADPLFLDYFGYAANHVSMFFMQDFFAVKFLKEKQLVPPDTVFAPGHSGDFLGGSQLVKNQIGQTAEPKEIVQQILKIKYTLNPVESQYYPLFAEKIRQTIDNSATKAFSVFEDWDMKEKLAKFIFNSACVFSFFEYEYRFPLLDKELLLFFRALPFEYKWHKQLYDEVLRYDFFEPLGINFSRELQPSPLKSQFQNLKNGLKTLLPASLVSFFQQEANNSFYPIFYKEITEKMRQDMRKNRKIIQNQHTKNYNAFIVQWYLWQIGGQ